MKKYNEYIRHRQIEESIDDNFFWKLNTYFNKKDDEKKSFIDVVDYFRKTPGFNQKSIEDYMNMNKDNNPIFGGNLKIFIDFIDDTIHIDINQTKDYIYGLYLILKKIIEDKTTGLSYTNKENL